MIQEKKKKALCNLSLWAWTQQSTSVFSQHLGNFQLQMNNQGCGSKSGS